MTDIASNIQAFRSKIPDEVELIAISKTKPVELINKAYRAGHRAFGENKVQEMVAKSDQLPTDIQWHMVGHLQSNKVKYIAPFVHLIHSVDSLKLLKEINKRGAQNSRSIQCLLQVHVATEATKFGWPANELMDLVSGGALKELRHTIVSGIMGMATNTQNPYQVRGEFRELKKLFDLLKQNQFSNNQHFKYLSMGMSNDYTMAIEEGSNMIRIGSAIFGARN